MNQRHTSEGVQELCDVVGMNPAEAEHAIAALQGEVEELRDRVADLELRVAGGHSCLIDICDIDTAGHCRLRPVGDTQEES